MSTEDSIERNLIEKLRRLPPERIAEVEDFIDFLHARQESRRLVNESLQLSEAAFQQVWNNPDDADYDRL
jgi:hypothetical protein